MTYLIILIVFYITFPIFLIWITGKSKLLKRIGAIVLAYALGIVIGNIGILPKQSEAFRDARQDQPYLSGDKMSELIAAGTLTEEDLTANRVALIQDSVMSAIVPLALPLILFSLNVRRWLRFSGKGFLSMVLALVSVSIIVASGYLIFRNAIPGCDKIGGMLIGCYTGGTVNMASISVALKVEPHSFIIANTYDIMVGAVTILFFMTAGPAFFRKFLPPFKAQHGNGSEGLDFEKVGREMTEEFEDFSGMFKKDTVLPLIGAFGIAVIIFVSGFGVSLLLPGVPQLVSVILTITTLGIAASFVPWVRKIKKTFQLGMYFIIAFSLVMASMCDLAVLFQAKYLNLLLYVLWAYFGSLLLHLFLSWLFRVNADDYLITTTGFVYSPPFVPIVASALKNKDVILTGLATGIIGWAIGNYMGVAFGLWLGSL